MFFIAKDLEDIAKVFDQRAENMRRAATAQSVRSRARCEGEAYGWEQAASIVRQTRFKDDPALHHDRDGESDS